MRFAVCAVAAAAGCGRGAQRELVVTDAIPDAAWEGHTILAQLSPEDGNGRVYTAVDTIPSSLRPSFDFSLPRDAFGGDVKDYVPAAPARRRP